MFRTLKYILAVLVALLCMENVQAATELTEAQIESGTAVKSSGYVLIINCHLETTNWNHNFEDEIIAYTARNGGLEVYSEHLKTLDIRTLEELEDMRNVLAQKYVNRPAAVVFIGPAAFTLFAPTFQKKWNGVPMIAVGLKKKNMSVDQIINQENVPYRNLPQTSLKELQEEYNVTGLLSTFYIKETIELMESTIKGMNHIVWLGDNRQGSIVARMQAQEDIAKYFPNITMEFLSPETISTEMLLKKISQYDRHTGILFHTWFKEGHKSQNFYMSNNIYKLLSNFASVPVFTLWDMNTEAGYIAGGHFALMEDQSALVVDMLKRTLAGEHASDIPFAEPESHKNYLNYATLQNYHIDNIRFPDDVVYFHKPENIFYVYRYWLIGFGLLLIMVFMYIAMRMKAMGKIQKIQRERIAKENELRKEIEVRNIKLALSLDVSNVKPWVMDLGTKRISFDDIEAIISNPQDMNTQKVYDCDELLGMIEHSDRMKVDEIITNLRDGKVPYVREDIRIMFTKDGIQDKRRRKNNPDKAQTEDTQNEYSWYTFQATVFERDNLNKPKKIMGTLVEITEIKNTEIELRNAKEKAEESDKLKSAFLANMSHEIRTPLNAIVGFSGIIASEAHDDRNKEISSIIQQNNNLLLKLLDDIMNLSKIEAGLISVINTPVNMNKLMDNLGSDLRRDVSKQKPVKVEIDCAMPYCVINSDKKLITMVLANFISNAAKFTECGHIRIGYYPPERKMIRCFVKDTGCGIPQSDVKMIFARFVKLKRFKQGSGLGLSICSEIIKQMGGNIGVYSKEDEGSEFWFEIPYEEAVEADEVFHEKMVARG